MIFDKVTLRYRHAMSGPMAIKYAGKASDIAAKAGDIVDEYDGWVSEIHGLTQANNWMVLRVDSSLAVLSNTGSKVYDFDVDYDFKVRGRSVVKANSRLISNKIRGIQVLPGVSVPLNIKVPEKLQTTIAIPPRLVTALKLGGAINNASTRSLGDPISIISDPNNPQNDLAITALGLGIQQLSKDEIDKIVAASNTIVNVASVACRSARLLRKTKKTFDKLMAVTSAVMKRVRDKLRKRKKDTESRRDDADDNRSAVAKVFDELVKRLKRIKVPEFSGVFDNVSMPRISTINLSSVNGITNAVFPGRSTNNPDLSEAFDFRNLANLLSIDGCQSAVNTLQSARGFLNDVIAQNRTAKAETIRLEADIISIQKYEDDIQKFISEAIKNVDDINAKILKSANFAPPGIRDKIASVTKNIGGVVSL